jgi:hypothetical protein
LVGGKTVFNNGQVNGAHRGRRLVFDHQRGGYWKTPDGIGV